MTKYLPQHGWEPVVCTAHRAQYPVLDDSLEADIPAQTVVLRVPIWEPYGWYNRLTGRPKKEKVFSGFLHETKRAEKAHRFALWIRANVFLPDARCGWIRPTVRYLTRWLAQNKIDALVTTGPPHSVHLIGYALRRKFPVPWLADFRDPWTQIDFYHHLPMLPWADSYQRYLEKKVLRLADAVTAVSWTMADSFAALRNRPVDVVLNGFDEEDFQTHVARDEQFSLVHTGSINRDRNPSVLWKACQTLLMQHPQLREVLVLRLIGKTDQSVLHELNDLGLLPYAHVVDYVSHQQIVREQQKAAVLLLLINNTPSAKGIIPGKVYEYLAARRPILCIGPTGGDVERLLIDTGVGKVFGYDEIEPVVNYLGELYQGYLRNQLEVPASNLAHFSRRRQAGQVADLLNRLVAEAG